LADVTVCGKAADTLSALGSVGDQPHAPLPHVVVMNTASPAPGRTAAIRLATW
jgi:hypothetical protein